jgi:hypothetical protein
MSFFRRDLTPGQLAALVLIKTMAAKAAGGGNELSARLAVLIAKQQWEGLAAAASLLSGAGRAPSASDFRTVGTMSPRLQSAYFLQSLAGLGSAFEPDGWDKLADAARRAAHALNPDNW